MKINPMAILLGLLFIVNLIDLITAKRILAGEANPIYVLTQSYLAIAIAKLVFILLIIYLYKKSKTMGNKTLFFIIMLMVYAFIGMSLGVYSNLSVSDEVIERVEIQRQEWVDTNNTEAIEQMDKKLIRDYTQFAFGVIYFPLIFGMISFIIWEKTKKYYENKQKNTKVCETRGV